jgi:hypothetical protein
MKKLISMLVLGMLVVSSVAAFAGESKGEKPADNQTESKYYNEQTEKPADKPADETQPAPAN